MSVMLRALPLIMVVVAQAAAGQRDSSTMKGPGAARSTGFYDPALRRVVMIGGSQQLRAGDRDRVWSWTGARWEPVTDSGPPARSNGGAAYDTRRQIAVVSGGMRRAADDSTYEIVGDVWQGTSARWQRMNGSDIGPRDHHAMVFDEERGAMLLFGGIPANRSAAWPSETLELGPQGWRSLAIEGPAGRARTAMVYDSKRRHVVLFGGVGAAPGPGQPQPFFSDTWIWERGAWRRAAESGPQGRYAHGMVFDERAGVVLLYSGAAAHRNAPLTDMWQWDGARWAEIRLTGPTPGYRYQPVMVYDRARGVTVLYGGSGTDQGDTWEWDGRRWISRPSG
jgi:hypothetical protein